MQDQDKDIEEVEKKIEESKKWVDAPPNEVDKAKEIFRKKENENDNQ